MERFSDKYLAEGGIGLYIALFVMPLLLSFLATYSFWSDYTFAKDIFKFTYLPLAITIGIASIVLGIYLDKKERFISLKKKFKNDEYFNRLKKRQVLIDIILITNGLSWIVMFIIANA